MTDAFRQAFIGESDLGRLHELAIRHGMVPMVVDALEKAREGQTSVAEVMRVVLLGV
jgi:type II secretory ATPase GspE/PulE/Tfp pilus assembly ATPase PilB-like protein